jgi:hypothetical protein
MPEPLFGHMGFVECYAVMDDTEVETSWLLLQKPSLSLLIELQQH